MRLRYKALILVFLMFAWRGNLRSSGNQYDPPPLPDPLDLPFPDDPPDFLTDPFDPISDLPDPWEREGEESAYFFRFSPDAYAVGIDILLYALTH